MEELDIYLQSTQNCLNKQKIKLQISFQTLDITQVIGLTAGELNRIISINKKGG
jgi:hypothetical protein